MIVCQALMNDEESLKSLVDQYQKLGRIHLEKVLLSISNKISKLYLKNLQYQRGISLMAMFSADDTDFFEVPSVPSLFHSIHSEPSSAMISFQPMFLQLISFQLNTVYSSPKYFSKGIIAYFNTDISSHIQFAYCTFPAIFGNFVTTEFCESASAFIINYILLSPQSQIFVCEELITSLFHGASTFYYHLWSMIASKLDNETYRLDFNSLFNILSKSLDSSMQFLQPSFVNVFGTYCQKFPNKCITFFIKSLFIQRFSLFASSSDLFLSPKVNASFATFLVSLLDKRYFNQAEELLTIFLSHDGFNSPTPDMSSSLFSHGVPILLSHRDFLLLTEIIPFLNSSINIPETEFLDTFDPLVMNVFPVFADSTQIPDIGNELFGQKPPTIDSIGSESDMKVWRFMLQKAADFGEYPDNFIIDNLEKMHDKRVGLRGILSLYSNNYLDLEKAIFHSEIMRQLEELGEVTQHMNFQMFHSFSYNFIHSEMRRLSTKKWIPSSIVSWIPPIKTSGTTVLEVVCTGLDALSIKMEKASEYDGRFKSILNNWAEKEWPRERHKWLHHPRMKHLLSTSQLLGQLSLIDYGKRLKVVLRFQKRLEAILGSDYDDQWSPLFHFLMFTASSDSIFSTFIFFYHFIFAIEKSIDFGPEIHHTWELFATGMWSIIKDDDDLIQEASLFEKMAPKFVIKA